MKPAIHRPQLRQSEMEVRDAAIVAFHSLKAAAFFSVHSGLSTRSKRFSIPKVITTNIPSGGG